MFKLFNKERLKKNINSEKETNLNKMENRNQNIDKSNQNFLMANESLNKNGIEEQNSNKENDSEKNSDLKELQQKIINILKTCYDPEIPVDIWELGLIYEVQLDLEKNLRIVMTLTSPMCPVAGSLPIEVEEKLKSIPEIKSVKVDIVWEPPWNYDMMSEAAKLELGFM
ncbi:MAG: hypothetical protein STSR0008_22240 [Ignavibacterium sp.]